METKRIRVAAVAMLIVTFVCVVLSQAASLQRGPAQGQIGNAAEALDVFAMRKGVFGGGDRRRDDLHGR